MSKHRTTDFDLARDELFSHIHRCGVLKANEDQQGEWITDTMDYIAERFPMLDSEQMEELRAIGIRFCRPAIPHGKKHTALTREEDVADEGDRTESSEMAGAA